MNIKDLKPGSYTITAPNALNASKSPTKSSSLVDKVGGGLDAVFGGKQIGESLVKAGTNVANLATGGISKFEQNLPQNTVNVPNLIGDYTKASANFIPGAGEAANLVAKTAVGAGTGYAMDVGSKLKNSEQKPFMPGAATVVAGSIPVVGAAVARPGVAILGRLLKGVGSGLSGVPVHQIEQIFNNPEAATKATQQIAKAGKSGLLEDNARTIVNGVSKVRQEARQAYGTALGALKSEDINPQTFRNAIQPVLNEVGSVLDTKTNTRILNNIEFDDPKNIAKASSLIDDLSKTPLDGLSLRNLSNKIETAKYKTATSDERLAFNAFLNKLDDGLKGAINSSTDKLQEMNKKFSSDMQLAEAVQGIFGKIKFKNLQEVNRASQKLESIFEQKGLSPEITNDFLKRIGVNAEHFKTSEAVRQLEGKEAGANSVGLSIGEIARGVTSSIVTPEAVGAISAKIGGTKETLEPFLKSLPLPTRNLVVQALLQLQANNQSQEAQGTSSQ